MGWSLSVIGTLSWFCHYLACLWLYTPVNSYNDVKKVSVSNHTFQQASFIKLLTSDSCTKTHL